MKVLINPLPTTIHTQPIPANLSFVQQPNNEKGVIFSVLIGLLIPFVPFALLSIQAALFSPVGINNEEAIPVWILVPVLIVCVFFHELLHLIWHPGGGHSDQSTVIIWPRKIQFGVFYDGFMTRSRWLVMRLSPLVGLTLLPTVFLLWAYFHELNFFWQQFVVLIILVNSLGSGGDLLASIIVFRQVPARGEIGIWNGRACWRPLI